jgi:L-asparagine oxygenase
MIDHRDVLSHLHRHGLYHQSGFDAGECLTLAHSLGQPQGERRDPSLIRPISPQPTDQARPNTLSSRYGLGPFPFHTDAAYWRHPPRFILFHCQHPGSGRRPTLLVDSHSWQLTSRDHRLLCNEVWRLETGRPFLCTVATIRQEQLAFRFDAACMRPLTSAALHAHAIIRDATRGSKVARVEWRPNDLLVIDNFRLLHARGEASAPDCDRVLARVLIRE